MGKVGRYLVLAGMALAPLAMTGCTPSIFIHPFSMGFATPIPVPPWVTERMQDKYCWLNDHRTPILPPIKPGQPLPTCEDPPDEAMILRAIPRVKRGYPYFNEEFRDDVDIVTERLVDRIDPGRFYPLIGPAQLHHCHYKCTVYYTETLESGYPFPFQCKRRRVRVVYIDKDHLHLCPGPNPAALESTFRDLSGP